MGVVAIVGCHEGQAGVTRKFKQGFIQPVQFRYVLVTLDLQIEVIERVAVPQRGLACVVEAAFEQEPRHLRGGASGECDET